MFLRIHGSNADFYTIENNTSTSENQPVKSSIITSTEKATTNQFFYLSNKNTNLNTSAHFSFPEDSNISGGLGEFCYWGNLVYSDS